MYNIRPDKTEWIAKSKVIAEFENHFKGQYTTATVLLYAGCKWLILLTSNYLRTNVPGSTRKVLLVANNSYPESDEYIKKLAIDYAKITVARQSMNWPCIHGVTRMYFSFNNYVK